MGFYFKKNMIDWNDIVSNGGFIFTTISLLLALFTFIDYAIKIFLEKRLRKISFWIKDCVNISPISKSETQETFFKINDVELQHNLVLLSGYFINTTNRDILKTDIDFPIRLRIRKPITVHKVFVESSNNDFEASINSNFSEIVNDSTESFSLIEFIQNKNLFKRNEFFFFKILCSVDSKLIDIKYGRSPEEFIRKNHLPEFRIKGIDLQPEFIKDHFEEPVSFRYRIFIPSVIFIFICSIGFYSCYSALQYLDCINYKYSILFGIGALLIFYKCVIPLWNDFKNVPIDFYYQRMINNILPIENGKK